MTAKQGASDSSQRVIDAQVHLWEPDSPSRPWKKLLTPRRGGGWDDPVTAEVAIAAMDAVGVDVIVAVVPTLYDDANYAIEASRRFPDRIFVVPHISINTPDLDFVIATYAAQPEVVAMRVSLGLTDKRDFERYRQGKYAALFTAAERVGLPIMLWVSGNLAEACPIARDYPHLQFVIDHMGMLQPPRVDPGAAPFASLPDLLALAALPNVAVKLSGVPSLSVEAFPFSDLWPTLHQVFRAFGAERLMWGSDFTQKRTLHSYADALGYIRDTDQLSHSEKSQVLGSTAERLLRMRPATATV